MTVNDKPRGSSDGSPGLARRTAIVASIAVGAVLVALLVWYSLHVLLLIFAGILAATAFCGLADMVADFTRLRYGWSLAIVLTILLLIVAGFGRLAMPPLLEQINQLGGEMSTAGERLREQLGGTRLGASLMNYLPDNEAMVQYRDKMLGSVGALLNAALNGVVTIVVVGFIGLFVAAEPKLYLRGVLRLFPQDRRDRLSEVMGAVGYTLKWWLIGQGVDMIIVGALTTLGLWWIGVPLPLLIGVLAGVLNFIPNFGPIIALIPAALLALTVSPAAVLWVVLLYLVLQSLEGYVLLPLIQRRAVDLPGAMIIASQVLLGLLAGPLGLVLATPLAAVVFVAVKMLYVEDMLGDYIDNPAHGEAREEIRTVKQAKREVNQST